MAGVYLTLRNASQHLLPFYVPIIRAGESQCAPHPCQCYLPPRFVTDICGSVAGEDLGDLKVLLLLPLPSENLIFFLIGQFLFICPGLEIQR